MLEEGTGFWRFSEISIFSCRQYTLQLKSQGSGLEIIALTKT
jgi:hypothetical protein